MNGKKRNKVEVINDILKTIQSKHGPIKSSHIMFKSNLSYEMMKEYLKELLEKGFIAETNVKKSKTYTVTEKGQLFMDKFRTVDEFFNSFGI